MCKLTLPTREIIDFVLMSLLFQRVLLLVRYLVDSVRHAAGHRVNLGCCEGVRAWPRGWGRVAILTALCLISHLNLFYLFFYAFFLNVFFNM